jgi:hypothetical protein
LALDTDAYVDVVDAATAALAGALAAGPLGSWLAPHAQRRSEIGGAVCAALTLGAAQTAAAEVHVCGSAAAIWYEAPRTPCGDWAARHVSVLSPLLNDAVWGGAVARLLRLGEVVDQLRPAGRHDFLLAAALPADAPAAGAVLNPRHAVLDRVGRAAFTIAVSAAGRDQLVGHGYRVVRHAVVLDAVPVWSMQRDPTRPGP